MPSSSSGAATGQRPKHPLAAASDAAFRLLIPATRIGAIIGKSGATVRLIQQETGARIRVQNPVPSLASEERVVFITGSLAVTRTLSLNSSKPCAPDGFEEFKVSPAQEALIRVLERLLDVSDGPDAGSDAVSCRLLATSGRVGRVMGRGGKVIERIRKESGARIRAFNGENEVPSCASPSDEVIQITGDALAVKRALISVSRCLQENMVSDRTQVFANRPSGLHEPSLGSQACNIGPGTHLDHLSQGTSIPPPPTFGSSPEHVRREVSLTTAFEKISMHDQKASQKEVTFRLLCSNDRVGGVIGKGGMIVKALEIETRASINVGPPVAESDYRVITITAMENPDSDYSPALDAVARVLARIIEVGIERGLESGLGNRSCISARLLVPSNQIGCLVGKEGEKIAEISKATGAGIRVFGGDQVPNCASDGDEVVQIIGDISPVKEALLYVLRCLKENLPSDKLQDIINGTNGFSEPFRDPHRSVPDPPLDEFLRRSPFLSKSHRSSPEVAGSGHASSTPIEKFSMPHQMKSKQEVVFRLLCVNDRVGAVIGKGGTIVKAIQNETHASIIVGPTVAETKDRVITVSATETLELPYSPAQTAVARVFARSVEAGFERGLDPGLRKGAPVSARLLVPSEQIGLMGKVGIIITEISQATGATIRIFRGDQISKCALENDEVLEITGLFRSVHDALFCVTGKLRDNMSLTGVGVYPSTIPESAAYGRTREPSSSSVSLPYNLDGLTPMARNNDHVRPYNFSHSSEAVCDANARDIADIGGTLPSYGGHLELGSGNKPAKVKNRTVDIMIPKHIMGAVYGERGNNLNRIREISGAKVVVCDRQPGVSEVRIAISGTSDQTQAAQSLLQAFIISGFVGADSKSQPR